MSFILFIFLFGLVLVLMILSFGLSIIRGILSLIFPSLRRRAQSQSFYGQSQSSAKDASSKKKIIDSNEGDYAEYEEIKN